MKEIDNYEEPEELSGPESSGKNWKGIGIALLVIAVICALVILAIVLIAPSHEEHFRTGQPLTLYDVTDGSLSPSFKDIQWLSGHELLYQGDTNQSIIVYNLRNKTKSILLDLRISEKIDSYSVSPSRQYLLYTQRTEKVYRHTNRAHYKLLDLTKPASLNDSWDLVPDTLHHPVKLQYAKWAATEDKLVFVYQNDVYVQNSPKETAVRLTENGSTDDKPIVVYNGIPDWLYEEEILSGDHAVWWSPDNKYLAYLSFNDTLVETFSFDTYGGDSMAQQYVNSTKIRYPKAGRRNPTVKLYIVDTVEAARTKVVPGESTLVQPPHEFLFKDYYITTVTWLSPDSLFVRWTNRYQNQSMLSSCSPKTFQCSTIAELKSPNGWLEDSKPLAADQGRRILMVSPNLSANDEVQHQTICTFIAHETSGGPRSSCLNLAYDVTDILAVDPVNGSTIYAIAAFDHPRNRHIVKIEGETTTCLTCNLTKCTYYDDTTVSPVTREFLVFTCRGPNVPYTEVWRLADLMGDSTEAAPLDVLKSNSKLQLLVNRKALPHRKYLEVPLSSLPHGPKAQVELLIPPKLAEYVSKRYPLLIKVYAGPGTQEVHSRYRIDFEELLASSHEVVIARIDARGSGLQGNKLKQQVYRNLGRYEIKDQLEVVKHILDTHPFLDPARVGIWGWSYGGYAAARAVLLDNAPQILRCAAAVAPVTDWRFYDTAYTERFMSTPEDNLKAYEDSNLMPYNHDTLYWHFARTSFLLVHGTADDNVHFQQAAQFTKALMKADILFKTQFYPDEDHSIRKLRLHLYHTLLDHFLNCFGNDAAHEKGDE